MTRIVQCVVLKIEAEGLDKPPHPGELARLLGVATAEVVADRRAMAQRAAAAAGAGVTASALCCLATSVTAVSTGCNNASK